MSTNNHYKAEAGYKYHRNGIVTDELWLGINDSIDNWQVISDEEARRIEEEHEKEALSLEESPID